MVDQAKPGRKRGRPANPDAAKRRNNVTIRMSDALKAALQDRAEEHGRSLSEEIERQLDRLLEQKEMLPETLEQIYGRQLAGLLLLLGKVMRDSSRSAAFSIEPTLEAAEGWMDRPWAFEQAAKAAVTVIEAVRPEGEPAPPHSITKLPDPIKSSMLNVGESFARTALLAVHSPDRGPTASLIKFGGEVRDLLGPAANRIAEGSHSNG